MYKPDRRIVEPEDLPAILQPVMERVAEAVHDTWAAGRLAEGWVYGPHHDETARTHPGLIPFEQLPESEKLYDRRTAAQTIQCLLDMGYRIER